MNTNKVEQQNDINAKNFFESSISIAYKTLRARARANLFL